jgi:uncharacterized protein YndB with AHSA1/START domain
MAVAKSRQETTLRIERTFSAKRERVFHAWTDPQALMQWWVPFDGYTVPSAELDVRAGGAYHLRMKNPKGEMFSLVGRYVEVRPPERLVYTWRWEGIKDDIGETLVTVEFLDRGEATEVRITHELFPDVHARDRHGEGWSGCLGRLAALAKGDR